MLEFWNRSKANAVSIGDFKGSYSIQLEDVAARINGRAIIENITTQFSRGEFTVLLGPNGAGKSTLLKTITGEVNTMGKTNIFGRASADWQPEQLARHLSALPQHSSLSFNFSAQEVVELGSIGLSLGKQALELVVKSNMEAVGVDKLSDRSYPSLSGGEKQRVHFARVLTQTAQSGDNKILLLDEPTSALDLQHQHSTLSLAKKLAHEGATVIAVLHDLNLAAQYADRIMILNQGEIVMDGRPSDALTSQTIAEVYHHEVTIMPHPQSQRPVVVAN